jgi:hypothetical protein
MNDVEDREQYRVWISNRFEASEIVDNEGNINKSWKIIRENITISAKESLLYYELKQHKPRFEEEYSQILGRSKQAKIKWFQDPSQINKIFSTM